MAALRWFLFSLLAFGGGAVGAFALHPPQLGIPDASAADLRSRLGKIESYASQGRCEAVKGQLQGAQATVDKLPDNTAVTVEQQLQNAIARVRNEALSTCLEVASAKQTNSGEGTAESTTPSVTPTPDSATPTPTPTTAPTATPTPDAATPTPDSSDPNGGGVTIPQGDVGAQLEKKIEKARERYRKAQEQIERALGQGVNP